MKGFIFLFAVLLSAQNLSGQALGDFIDSYVKKSNFNGTILIERKSKIVFRKSFGFANLQFRVPAKPGTKYKVASITKAFTAVLILQLYEQGKIELDKSIGTYLPRYRGEGAGRVTIHQLLNMTSGIENMDRNLDSVETAIKKGIPQYQTPFSSEEILEKFCSGKLVDEPGKVFDYNNADYIILGKIVEQIYGRPFEQVLRERILEPLGMKNSGMVYQHNIIENLADSYFFREDLKSLVNDLPVYLENWYAAGGMYSTAGDVLKFSNALFGMKLLKKETMDRMFTSGSGEYGYGVWVYEDYEINGRMFKIIKRPGSIMGAQSMLFHVLGEGTTIIILSNAGTADLDRFVAEIAKKAVK